jgi:hypothetical protein
MLDLEIAVQLVRRGWDVESIQREHRDLMGLDDHLVLEHAIELGRTLVTDNARHFVPLHIRRVADQRPHAGLVVASSKRYPRGKRTIRLWVNCLDGMLKSYGDASSEDLCHWLK